jgi:hypothetical protein
VSVRWKKKKTKIMIVEKSALEKKKK